jgi:E3 ubiquitin-protein ligase UBR4
MFGAIQSTSGIDRDITLAERCLADLAGACHVVDPKSVINLTDLPSISTLYTLDVVLAHIQIALDDHASKSSGGKQDTMPPAVDVAARLLPSVLTLVRSFAVFIRSYLLGQVRINEDTALSSSALQAYNCVARVASSVNAKLGLSTMLSALPIQVRGAFEKWNAGGSCSEFPTVLAWRSAFGGDIIPAESYIDAVRGAHLAASPSGLGSLLRHNLTVLATLAIDLVVVWGGGDPAIASTVADVLLPLSCEVISDGLYDNISSALEKLIGPADSDDMMARLYACSIPVCRDIVVEHASSLDEQVIQEGLRFLESGLDRVAARTIMEKQFSTSNDLLTILLSASGEGRTPVYGTRVLKFFNKLVQIADKTPGDSSCIAMCNSLCQLAHVDSAVLQAWVSHMVVLPSVGVTEECKTSENRVLLQNLTSYIVKESSHVGAEVASAILSALIPMGSQVFVVMQNLKLIELQYNEVCSHDR